jgi:hypothetical protein
MRTNRDFYPLILVLSAIMIIIIVLSLVWLMGRLPQENENVSQVAGSTPVGYDTEADPSGWRPLFNGQDLDGWTITNFGPQGPVYVRDSAIILNFGDGATGITWVKEFPDINYEISLEAMRIDGNDFFCGLTFPAGDSPCSFIVGGWGGSLVGLSTIDGKDASENFTGTRMQFNNGTWYEIRLVVTGNAITGFIDDTQVFDVPMDEHSFSIRPEVGLSRPLGFATWVTSAALRDIRFREI